MFYGIKDTKSGKWYRSCGKVMCFLWRKDALEACDRENLARAHATSGYQGELVVDKLPTDLLLD